MAMACSCDTPNACAARGLCRREAREMARQIAAERAARAAAEARAFANVIPFPRRPNGSETPDP